MNNEGRINNSTKNTILGIAVQASNILMSLVVRTVFIRCLSADYLGINGVFTNILTMLSLAEMGVGSAIVYNMYKPIAQDDKIQIAKLMNLYRKAYAIIGVVVLFLGLAVTPFLDYITGYDANVENIVEIYLLFLCNTVLSYFFAYKRSIFSADQKERVLHVFKLVFHILRSAIQVLILIFWKLYIAYLITQIIFTLIENISVSFWADRSYPFLKIYKEKTLEKQERKKIFADIKSLFIYKIGSTVLDGTDSVIISATNGVVSVGLLSNYTLLTGSIQTLLSQVSISITGSVGNFIAKENNERHEALFNSIFFCYFILYGFAFTFLIAVLNPFVSWWAGDDYVLSFGVVFVHALNMYIYGMMNPIWTFRTTMGLFQYGKWRPLFSAIINLVVSIWWAKMIGIIGVLLGTTFTRIVTNVWFDPYIVYTKGFRKSPFVFYIKWVKFLTVCLIDIAAVCIFEMEVVFSGIAAIIVYGGFSFFVFIAFVLIFFRKSEEYRFFSIVLKRTTALFFDSIDT